MTKRTRPRSRPFAYEGLDRAMHERARLGVLTCLLAHAEGLSFSAIKQLCGLTDGNLARHLEVLESAHLIQMTKTVEENRTQTFFRLSAAGRKRFLAYLAVLQQVLLDANGGSEAQPNERGPWRLQQT